MEITQNELASAICSARSGSYGEVRFPNYTWSDDLARDLLNTIQTAQGRRQREKQELHSKLFGKPDSFSETEIADALRVYGYGTSSGAALAAEIAKLVRRKRDSAGEPTWRPGDVIKSAKGKVLVRTKDARWYRAEDGLYFDDHRITRPLTVLLRP